MINNKKNLSAPIAEIFRSFQGEGLYAGEPQLFIRFAGCNINCCYCDTDYSAEEYLSAPEIVKKITHLTSKKPKVSTISLTGGEPLIHAGFLLKFLKILKESSFKVYLETNGTMAEEYRMVKKYIDVTSMDIKLPSDTKINLSKRHSAFLKLLKKNSFIKIVLSDNSNLLEFKRALNLIKKIAPSTKVVLQPATPSAKTGTVQPEMLYIFFSYARKLLKNVFLIPQLHRTIWNIR